jgi:predicted 2-oxoglutarate/Fe(II)-dependent dioxygenase YbiX/peroxiredoxin
MNESRPTPPFEIVAPGDPAPWFEQRTAANPAYSFDTIAGRYVVLCFLASASDDLGRSAIEAARTRPDLFDDRHASFFGVSLDPRDEAEGRLKERYPGIRFFHDFDGEVSRRYGAIPKDADVRAGRFPVRRFWLVLDPTLRVMHVSAFDEGHAALIDYVATLPPPSAYAGVELQAPILILPQVFEPAFCRALIELYERQGGAESGFMVERDGKTVGVVNASHKRRKDVLIKDPDLIAAARHRILRRVVPEIEKAHQFRCTRMERYIVACYAAEDGGHFRAHRDNTTKGTAHRRFAVSVVLSDDYEGGEVSFPEYGPRGFKPRAGGAVVFSCSLLHAVAKVTAGRRYAFLPFLYDEAAAKIREENAKFTERGENYRA